jgi:hypothetical protein
MATTNDDFPNNSTTTGTLVVDGGYVPGRIDTFGDHDWLKVTLITGQTYSFYLNSGDRGPDDLSTQSGNASLVLYDYAGNAVASNVGAHSVFTHTRYFNFTAPSAGDYYLDVSDVMGANVGNYAVKAVHGMTDDYPNTVATSGKIAVNGQATGTLQTGLDIDWFKTTLQKGHSYIIELLGKEGGGGTLGPNDALYLQLFSPAQADLGSIGSVGSPQGNPTLYVTAAASGDYIVDVESMDWLHDQGGSYTVRVTEVPVDDYAGDLNEQAARLAVGATLKGTLGHPGDVDAFRMEVQAGQQYLISLKDAGHAFMTVYDSDYHGQSTSVRSADDTGQVIYTAQKSGTLFVQLASTDGSTGKYSLSAQTIEPETTAPKLVSVKIGTEGGFWQPGSDIVISFNEAIRAEIGGMILYDGTHFRSYGPGYMNLSVDGNVLTWHMPDTLDPDSDFTLQIPEGLVKDLAGNPLAASGSFELKTRSADLQLGGTAGADKFTANSSGYDTFDGQGGVDTVSYAGKRADFTLSHSGTTFTVKDNSGVLGSDKLVNVERLVFSDATMALDVDGVAGQAYRLYQAAFDRAPDQGGLGFWISHMDTDTTLNQAAAFFLNSPEFVAKYGVTTDQEFVTKLYANVLHRAPDADGMKFWTGHLASDTTRAAALAYFSESPENHAALATIIGNGFEYQPMA